MNSSIEYPFSMLRSFLFSITNQRFRAVHLQKFFWRESLIKSKFKLISSIETLDMFIVNRIFLTNRGRFWNIFTYFSHMSTKMNNQRVVTYYEVVMTSRIMNVIVFVVSQITWLVYQTQNMDATIPYQIDQNSRAFFKFDFPTKKNLLSTPFQI